MQRGQFLYRLNRLVASLLDSDSKLHCQVGNIRDGVLILYADSAGWASRLRYQAPTLLKQLQQRKGLEKLQKIELRVLPEQQKEETKQRAEMSAEASSCIQACSESIEDKELSRALARLAAHRKD